MCLRKLSDEHWKKHNRRKGQVSNIAGAKSQGLALQNRKGK